MSKEKKEPAEETGFKVSDKRHFTAEGYVLPEQEGPAEKSEEAPESPASAGEGAAGPAEGKAAAPGPEGGGAGVQGEPREKRGAAGAETVDFTQLVMSLAGTAYHALGVPDPITKEKGIVNLQAAGQMIDLLAVLNEKTRGNLSSQEEQVLQSILTELRSLYIQTQSAP